jgi:hypothetical protein
LSACPCPGDPSSLSRTRARHGAGDGRARVRAGYAILTRQVFPLKNRRGRFEANTAPLAKERILQWVEHWRWVRTPLTNREDPGKDDARRKRGGVREHGLRAQDTQFFIALDALCVLAVCLHRSEMHTVTLAGEVMTEPAN